ncbi:MAG TPA: peptidase M28 [Algoriphagus sp.]|jgi:Zn-dependent M28 family amino/carboxypeptidase|uniref:M28 family metallopeptidase n=1 Tax=unclassified Algoriphagus TaxID=2641541 RepID=UPI000C4CA917|nr:MULTISPECIES: M28 family metallopeptidase [unclassified Algoriphagus]MAL12536.1 peptidase M28 [Algoriphagus sp.]HAS57013.1 peptidase M28 [Algoriphagus sp.]HCB46999.1 peptidase M28 [Algoriphagus sp.]HCD88879.1 peptidase M28 [Algoriphagus sp.]|tara:strand:- start:2146 stop:3777 length:1632 start_codon:yes stop_codon:yes gene_type:complete
MRKTLFFLSILAALVSCSENQPYQFTVSDIETHIDTLSSDYFLGRMPFTEGEEKTVAYLVNEFQKLGLEPGNGDSYIQEVPMVSILTQPSETMEIQSAKEKISLNGLQDYVFWTQRTDSAVSFQDAEMVFAGFGIVAPEYGWDDYKNIDVKDKIVVVLVNDPGFGTEDASFFKGNTMTYYGRWTYKYEEAIRQGALGCLIVHNTIPAGYGFNVIQNSWNSSKLYLDDRGKEGYKLAFEGWVTLPTANRLFEMAGLNERELLAKARKPDFQAIPLNLKASSSMKVEATNNTSQNVVAKLTGEQNPDEYIVYTAHWDHLGVGKPDASGDSIYNGALDNASGTAALLALAKAFKESKTPNRSVIFLAVTAEEQGLWGSAYYAQNPIYPLEKTVANINMDGINPYGKMKDVSVIGVGQSEMEELLDVELEKLGRYSAPEPNPVAGYYFRSDHFNFAKVGVPALYFHTGIDHVEKGKEYGKELQDQYTAEYYHKPSDEYDSSRWNLDGAVDDVQLLYNIGQNLANSNQWPSWKPGSEFKSIREGYMKK